jgi:hypothetical protein
MSTTAVKTIGAFCKRYGPGRLPGAGRPAVGAGYALATAALAAAVAFIVVSGIRTLLVFGSLPITGGLWYFGLLAVPLVVPAAFVGGAVAWRLLPESVSYRGPLAGLLATVLAYVVATLLMVATLLIIFLLNSGPEPVRGSVVIGLLYGGFGFIYTFWLTLPISAFSGWIHERAVTGH